MSRRNISVLIVDDNPGFVKRMKMLVGELDYIDSIHSAGDFDEAVWQLDRNKQNTVLLGINFPGRSGISLLTKIKEGVLPAMLLCFPIIPKIIIKSNAKNLAPHFLDKTTEFDLVPSVLTNITISLNYVLK